MDEINVLLESIERIYSNIDSIENDSFKTKFNKYVLIKSKLDSLRDRLDAIKSDLSEENIEESKEEINKILSELLGDGEEEIKEDGIEEDFNPEDISNLLKNMPEDTYPDEIEENNLDLVYEDDLNDKTEVLFNVNEINDILNSTNDEINEPEPEMLEIPEVDSLEQSFEEQSINLDELNSMIDTFE